jgi:hypothetical protein
MGCVVDIARGCSRFHAPTHKNGRSVHLETRQQLENPSAKPGRELSSCFSLQSLLRSQPCHRSLGQHASRWDRSAVSTSPRRTDGLSSRWMDSRPGGWVERTSVHRVRGSSSAPARGPVWHQEQRSNRFGSASCASRHAQVSDCSNHHSNLVLQRALRRARQAIRRTPRGAGWRLHPRDQPAEWNRTR